MARRRTRPRVAFFAASVLAATGGLAQEQEQPTELEDITVTATRAEKSLQQVPASIGVVDEEDIQLATQQLGLDESLVKVPGVFMQNRYNFAQDLRVSIRGFGARASFGIRGIKIMVDGIPETLPDGQSNVDSIDIGSTERIEVIRGPVSSLYGNASGGAILIESETPPEEPFVSIRPSWGDYDFQKHQIKLGGAQGKFGYLLNVADMDYGGYRDHSEAESTGFNSRFGYDIDDSSQLRAVVNFFDSPIAQDPGGLTEEQVKEDPTQARDRNLLYDAGERVEQSRLGLVYNKDFGESGQLLLRNYYVWRDFDNRLPFTDGGSVDLDRFFVGGGGQYTLGRTLAGRDNRLIFGVDLDSQDDDRQRFDNNFGQLGKKALDQNEDVSSQGYYLQDELMMTDQAELTFGARYDRIDYDVTDKYLADGDQTGKRKFDNFSPMAGLRFSPNQEVNLYGTISTSFEAPTTTELANPGGGGFNPGLEPATAVNYEIGVKGRLGQRNRYELALFRVDVEDELVPFELPDQPERTFYENAGESTHKGLELLLVSEPIEGFTASLAYTYMDSAFDKFVDGSGRDFGGNDIPGLPDNLLNLDFSYVHSTGFFGGLGVQYVDEFYANNANTATNPAYTVANLRLGYTGYFGNWEFSPFLGVNNLFDEAYNGNVRVNAFGGRYYEPAPELNVYGGFTLRYDFEP